MNFIEVKKDEDIKRLELLASEIWHDYWPFLLTNAQIDYMLNKFQSYKAINEQLLNDRYMYFILEDNGNEIGYFGVCPKDNYLFLSKLYIKKDFRGLGCGRLAFNKIKQIAMNCNKSSIQLTVNKKNVNSINVYDKWGFKVIDATVFDIGDGFVMDDYIMEYRL